LPKIAGLSGRKTRSSWSLNLANFGARGLVPLHQENEDSRLKSQINLFSLSRIKQPTLKNVDIYWKQNLEKQQCQGRKRHIKAM
jgi:hypothetical protein